MLFGGESSRAARRREFGFAEDACEGEFDDGGDASREVDAADGGDRHQRERVICADLADHGDGVVAAGEVGEVDDDVLVVGVGVDGVDDVGERGVFVGDEGLSAHGGCPSAGR
ncbi:MULTISPECIES: hypothetical protein [unclassified Rhodococcus (in: high G+C Gram-positive bacteria)]|uniref:hypothetical protein n=1 Tax=unclassified Rhodococcus (in: high G+C Gram-positive bacteria) TaxID=192944 RepID=UPI0035A95BED